MDLSSNIINTLKKLCSIKSTSGTHEEVSAAHEIYALISEIGYFKDHMYSLKLHDIKNDALHRKFISALYESGKSKRTAILLSHFDVVDIHEFGDLSKYAYCPDEYAKMLKGRVLNPGAASDLASGD